MFQDEFVKKLLLKPMPHVYLTKSCIEIITSAALSIIFKQPLLIVGHTGNSKTMCVKMVEEAFQSIIVWDTYGI
jgi:MoxR-like ATPase